MAQSPVTQFSGIFISYRRADSESAAGHLFDNLANHFGTDQIFMDIDNIEPGADFVKVIENAVGSCEIVVAVMGPSWLSISDGTSRRLDNPDDFVRLEIAAALERDIRVIPVLVEGAMMPRPQDLPDDIRPFCRRNAIEISHKHWRSDVARLIRFMEKVLAERNEDRQRREEEKRRTKEERQRRLAQEEQAKQRAVEERALQEAETRKKEEEEARIREAERARQESAERQERDAAEQQRREAKAREAEAREAQEKARRDRAEAAKRAYARRKRADLPPTIPAPPGPTAPASEPVQRPDEKPISPPAIKTIPAPPPEKLIKGEAAFVGNELPQSRGAGNKRIFVIAVAVLAVAVVGTIVAWSMLKTRTQDSSASAPPGAAQSPTPGQNQAASSMATPSPKATPTPYQKAPTFSEFPASVEKATAKQINFNSHPEAKNYPTRLKDAFSNGVNFAGHYIVETWTCAADCEMTAIIDGATGDVFFPKQLLYAIPADVEVTVKPRANSTLLIFYGSPADEKGYGIWYYKWTGKTLEFKYVKKSKNPNQ